MTPKGQTSNQGGLAFFICPTMSTISISENTILWTIKKGTSASLVINKADGWAMYDEIVMDFKYVKLINTPAFLTLSVGAGITLNGNTLTAALTYAQTAEFQVNKIEADIKLRIGTVVVDPIPVKVTLIETVTKVES